jgi:hypothetical protein
MIVGCLVAPLMLRLFHRRSLLLSFGWLSTVSILFFALCGAFVECAEWLKYAALAGMLGYIICWR